MSTIARQALALVRPRFALDFESNVHGAPHWIRVARNGRKLVKTIGLGVEDAAMVEWFAYLHDSCRLNDNRDHLHGERAAGFACTLRAYGALNELNLEAFGNLVAALAGHSDGHTMHSSAAVRVCWDADRLDLLRVGILPDPRLMCTTAGKEAARKLLHTD